MGNTPKSNGTTLLGKYRGGRLEKSGQRDVIEQAGQFSLHRLAGVD